MKHTAPPAQPPSPGHQAFAEEYPDCVKDRLASYYHFGDRQGLIQATMVAQHNPVDLKEIRRWSNGEGQLTKFEQFLAALETSA